MYGGHAYVAHFRGLCIVDVSDPHDPRAVGGLSWNALAYDVVVTDGSASPYVYVHHHTKDGAALDARLSVADELGGARLRVFDVTWHPVGNDVSVDRA